MKLIESDIEFTNSILEKADYRVWRHVLQNTSDDVYYDVATDVKDVALDGGPFWNMINQVNDHVQTTLFLHTNEIN
jgi:hypothetical protein